MIAVHQLQPGHYVTEQVNGQTLRLDIVAIAPHGRQVEVTFRSPLGLSQARYLATACIAARR
ncbi:hypothetical protein GCM10007860_09940 [Chitiniphilus shinanonensis]|uniref:Uncharacterized protein n=1 Tax=Chitiniphilus shinanonensis TaxID=553088 RepID=A0ABQ6BVQ8_9NEIS|nr:hypothetical protein [Chitiniphilus shinanonensis]GLS03849.1 hypothetical protein GCM10007860_09940 [Chitiniphilus shinanonensis]